ncbi:MAG: hypothetical protein IIA88_03785 [Bacteroidetes bacterium]|nr:hypothetical protein [Bacteroidota bacterium]
MINSTKKSNVFTVPDGYFDELPFIIQTKIYKKEEKASLFGLFSWVEFLSRDPEYSGLFHRGFFSKPVKYGLASFLIIMVLGYYLITLYKNGQNIDYLANITKEEIVDYFINEYVDEFEIMDIALKSEKPLNELIINDFEVTDDIIEEFISLDIDFLDYLE